jgi:predicted RND superfamily exporter protein
MGKGMIIGGIICLIIAAIFIVFAIISTVTYLDGLETLEDNKKYRDKLKEEGEDTSDLDEEISKQEATMRTKEQAMASCTPTGIVLVIVGIFLILKGRKRLSMVTQPQYPTPSQYPPPSQ